MQSLNTQVVGCSRPFQTLYEHGIAQLLSLKGRFVDMWTVTSYWSTGKDRGGVRGGGWG